MFGSKPTLSFGFDYDGYWADAKSTLVPGTGNSPLDVNGNVLATNFIAGTFVSEFQQKQYELGIELAGELGEDEFISPILGFFVRSKTQDHEVLGKWTSQPNNPRSLMDSDLTSRSVGLSIGANVQSPDYGGFRFSALPELKTSYTKSHMRTTQDKNGIVGGVPDGVSVTDVEHHVVVEPSLTMGGHYQAGSFTIGAEFFSAYSYGDALIRLSEKQGQPAQIDTNNDGYSYGGGLTLKVVF